MIVRLKDFAHENAHQYRGSQQVSESETRTWVGLALIWKFYSFFPAAFTILPMSLMSPSRIGQTVDQP